MNVLRRPKRRNFLLESHEGSQLHFCCLQPLDPFITHRSWFESAEPRQKPVFMLKGRFGLRD